ncbi:MAG: autotransporter domain-containing protein [Gammaproteobacteria bacterium]|nr:autotransporter domain-containing protein [Gammaproteobacteria bacterium]
MKLYKQIIVVITFALIFMSHSAMASESINPYVESDPIAFMLGGYSLHSGVEKNQWRAQLGVFAANMPQDMLTNNQFELRQSGWGIKLDYSFNQDKGWFIGTELEATQIDYRLSGSTETTSRASNLFGLRTGYRYYWTKQVFVTPWITVKRNLSDKQAVVLNNETYAIQQWIVFPTVHLGWQF